MTYPWPLRPGAPGHNWLSAASRAPGHGRPLAAQRAAGRDRLSAALPAPGADVPLATTARAPGQHRLRAAPIATVPSPAGLPRLRQGSLAPRPCQSPHPDLPALPPRHRPHPPHARPPSQPSFPLPPASFPRKRESTSPCSNGRTTGGLRTGNLRCVFPHFSVPITPHHPSSASCHPGTAPPAVLLHRGHGLPTPPPPAHPRSRPPPRHCGASLAIHVPLHCGGTIGGPLHVLCGQNDCPREEPGVRASRPRHPPSLMKVANLTR